MIMIACECVALALPFVSGPCDDGNVFIEFSSKKCVAGISMRVLCLGNFLALAAPKVQSKHRGRTKKSKLLCMRFIFQSSSSQTHKSRQQLALEERIYECTYIVAQTDLNLWETDYFSTPPRGDNEIMQYCAKKSVVSASASAGDSLIRQFGVRGYMVRATWPRNGQRQR